MNKKRGFTLIELLVVIAIIALLMSILMPALSKVRKQAMAVVCRSRLKQWGVIFSMYTGDNDGFFHAREVGTDAGYAKMWPYDYKKMYNDPKMRFCPTAENASLVTGPFGTWNYSVGSFVPLPNFPMTGEREYDISTHTVRDGFYTGSFGMNRYVENMKGGTMATNPDYWRQADAKGGDKVPVLMDSQYMYYWSSSTAVPPAYNGDYTTPEMHWICVDRHMGYINAVFLDFSARKVGLKELWALKHSRSYDTCDKAGWTICGFGGDKSACHAAWHDVASWMDKYPEY